MDFTRNQAWFGLDFTAFVFPLSLMVLMENPLLGIYGQRGALDDR